MTRAFVTAAAPRQLPQARALMRAVQHHHPGARCYCVLLDGETDFDPEGAFELIGQAGGDTDPYALYSAIALRQARTREPGPLIYLAPTAYLYRPLPLGNDALLAPLRAAADGEAAARRAPCTGLALWALPAGERGDAMLQWWLDRPPGAQPLDAALAQLAERFGNVRVSQDPGLNADVRTLSAHALRRDGDGWRVDGSLLTLCRFSSGASTGAFPELEDPYWAALDVTPDGLARLHRLYMHFLGRPPELAAVSASGPLCNTWQGAMRIARQLARSEEHCARGGRAGALLSFPLRELIRPARPAPRQDMPRDPPGINLIGYVAAELGLGEAARSLALACRAARVQYSAVDVGYQSSSLQRDTQALAHAASHRFAIDMVYVNAEATPATVAHLASVAHDAPYRIGYWHWEQPELPAEHLAAFAHVDEVWVPSQFVRDAVAPHAPVPVHVIPHALRVTPGPEATRAAFGLPEDKTLALVMYDFHSYQERKNPQAAIAAFRKAAQGRTDCALVIKTINHEHHPREAAELRAALAGVPAVVIDRFLTRQEVWDLQSCCDLLISLHRAEGFGLGPAEMMYLGKPVVATGWSANMDFMTAENSMPVAYTLRPLERDIGAYRAGPVWADADTDHAAACISQLLADTALRQRLGARAQADIRVQLAPEAVGRLVRARLEALAAAQPHLRLARPEALN